MNFMWNSVQTECARTFGVWAIFIWNSITIPIFLTFLGSTSFVIPDIIHAQIDGKDFQMTKKMKLKPVCELITSLNWGLACAVDGLFYLFVFVFGLNFA